MEEKRTQKSPKLQRFRKLSENINETLFEGSNLSENQGIK
jgi:hypothetical protein